MIAPVNTRDKPLRSWVIPASETIDFQLPPELEAGEPPEARGLARDHVRLMVSYTSDNRIINTQFNKIGEYLSTGDVLVINTSGTLNSSLNVINHESRPLELHLSTQLHANLWIVELRQIDQVGNTTPYLLANSGDKYILPGDGQVTLLTPY